MQRRQPFQTDEAIKLGKHFARQFLRRQIVTGLEDVRRIEADTQAFRFADVRDNVSEMFESIAEARSLPGGCLHRKARLDLRQAGEDVVDRLNDFGESRLLTCAKMSAGMQNQEWQFELVRAHEFLRKGAE